MSTDVMIYANDLSKSFGSFRALDKINFEVNRGEIVGFLGPNGAGKSTTMRILTCFIAPTGGHGARQRARRLRRPARRCARASGTSRSARRSTSR